MAPGSELNTDIKNRIHVYATQYTTFPEKPSEWLISAFNIYYVTYDGDGSSNPLLPKNTEGKKYFWIVLTIGICVGDGNYYHRIVQIAFQALNEVTSNCENAIFIRSQHDDMVTEWKQVC